MFHQQRLAAREGGQSFLYQISCNCQTVVCRFIRSDRRQNLHHATLITVILP